MKISTVCLPASVFLLSFVMGCGGNAGSPTTGTGSGGNTGPVPSLTAISPSSAIVGSGSTQLIAYATNLEQSAFIEWNGVALSTECVDTNLIPLNCSQAGELVATIPSTDLSALGSATVSVSNGTPATTSSAVAFNVVSGKVPANNWVRQVGNITVPNDIVWDSTHGILYVSVASSDPVAANEIAAINPVAGTVTSQTPAISNPNLMTISSDSSYLWVGLDGSRSVQRYLVPSMTKDIGFDLPIGLANLGEQAVSLQAAPVNPHTLGLVAGYAGYSPAGEAVYVYDDAVQRPSHVTISSLYIDWVQWGADDSVLYGNQYTTGDAGGIATLPVTPSGVTLGSYSGGLALQLSTPVFDRSDGLLYSYGGAVDPVKLTQAGSFNLPEGGIACTPDSSLNRYYCVSASYLGGSDVLQDLLLVYNLSNYALIDSVSFGYATSGGQGGGTSGYPAKLVRWGNAGLALITQPFGNYGSGGIFLFDGTAVNPNVPPDVSTGTDGTTYPSMASLSPASTTASSGTVTINITGTGFTPTSVACWSCSYIQKRLLPTNYVSPTQLTVIAPVSALPTNQPAEISIFDPGLNLFSSNALTFTVLPSGSQTQVTPVNLCGLGMAWDSKSQLLYVGAADYDGQYPNSIVALNPENGAVAKVAPVTSDPMYVSDGANGEYLYVAYEGSTNMTQLALPSLTTTATAVLANPAGSAWYPGDLKAAPVNPHTTAVTLIQPGWQPEALGGVVVFDDDVPRPHSMAGWTGGQTVPATYDTLAWSGTDQLLTGAGAAWDGGAGGSDTGPLYDLQVDSSGLSYLSSGTVGFNLNEGNIHSDFGTGLIYSDNGNVANPETRTLVGSYKASGLAAPDSTLNRVFFLGQTVSQSGTFNYTIQSFNETTFGPVNSIILSNVSGYPIEMVRWGDSGLAVLTSGGSGAYEDGFGMLYLIQDTSFVSAKAVKAEGSPQERVQRYWKQVSKRELAKQIQNRRPMDTP